MAEDNRILASVALFSELYDQKKDVYHLVGEFIRSAVTTERLQAFTVPEVGDLLKKHFDFELPVAVLRTVLRTRLKREGFCKSEAKDSFSIITANDAVADELTIEFERLQASYEEILEKLIDHTRSHVSGGAAADEDELKRAFHKFLLGEAGVGEEYIRLCSAFIVDHGTDMKVTEAINQIREGLVIYSGISSVQELNQLGTWKHDLNIVLDTELLLDLGGFNGSVYKEIFNDFHRLVNEVNNANRSKGGRAKISLSYFEASKNEIERIFSKAEKVLSGDESVHFATTAFRNVMDGCLAPSDVLTKKVRFFSRLQTEGIRQIDEGALHETIRFNVESQELLNQIRGDSKLHRDYDDEDVHHVLQQFTAVNKLRHGVSGTSFEASGAVLLTRDRVTRMLANNYNVKFHARDYPYAVDLDQVINRLWFNLNKGFTDKSALPKTFDMVTRSQIVLASQLRSSIAQRYSEIVQQRANGQITDRDALELFAVLRSQEVEPSKIDETMLDEILDFIGERDIATKIEELKTVKDQAAEVPVLRSELEEAVKHLDKTRAEVRRLAAERFERLRAQNMRLRFWVKLMAWVIVFLPPLAFAGAIYAVLQYMRTEADTTLGVLFGMIGLVALLAPLWGHRKAIYKGVRRMVNDASRQRGIKKRRKPTLRLR